MGQHKDLLIDVTPVSLQLVESGGKAGKTVVRGEFARAGVATENKRLYPKKVWEKEMSRLGGAMTERRVFGELDHPTDGRTSLQRVSHIVTGMSLKDGILVGEAEILPTEKGKILEALLKSGCKVGVSSRGFGSVKSNDEGVDEVQEDYKLVTFDFVADPADSTAYPEVFFEGVEFPNMADQKLDESNREDSDIRRHADDDKKTAEKWAEILNNEDKQAAAKAAAQEAETAAKAADTTPTPAPKEEGVPTLPDDLLNTLAKMRAEVREEVRGELLSDPAVAGAHKVVEQIKGLLRPFLLPEDAETVVEGKDAEIKKLNKQIAEQNLRIKDLEEDIEKLGNVAKEAGYKFYLERVLSEDPDAALIRNLIGDVKQFASSDELKTRVEEIRSQLAEKRAEEQEAEAKIAAQAEEIQSQAQALVAEAAARADKAEGVSLKLAEANKKMALQLYTAKKLRNHPRSAKIRSLIESSSVESTEDVDQIVEEYTESDPHDLNEAQDWRARVRKRVGSSNSVETTALDEEVSASKSDNGDLFGVPMSDLQRAAGIGGRR
jgi:hypothetical protein